MVAAFVLARCGIRHHRAALLGIAFVLAAGVGAGLTSLEVADRTASAYLRYRSDADVANLVVNPSMTTDETAGLLQGIDGVEAITSDTLLTAVPDVRATGGNLGDVSNFLQVRVSTDGRYLTQDRPVVHDGRMIRDGEEAFISEGTATSLGLDVGDEVPLLILPGNAEFTTDADELARSALDSIDVTIVGVGSFPDEVLPDDLFPRQKILVTPDVGARFDCIVVQPAADDPRTYDQLFAAFFPPDCSATYHYFSMRTTGGDAGAIAVGERIAAAFDAANSNLPTAMSENGVGYYLIPSFTADEARALNESLSPVVTSLRAFALAAILASVAVATILAVRVARHRGAEVEVWRSLGSGRRTRAVALALPALLGTTVGLAVAIAVAWMASSVGAIGSADAVEANASRSLEGDILLAAVLVFAVTTTLLILSIFATMPTPERAASSGSRASHGRANRPEITLGFRAARRGIAVLAASTVAVLTVTATLVFSASLLSFVDEPARFGWPYDVAALVNAGYDGVDVDAVHATLDDPDSGVIRWGQAALSLGTQVNGATVPAVGLRAGFESVSRTPVLRGRLPREDNEVALGELTADELGVEVGDEVRVSSQYGERAGTVTGLVVLPAIGALESDRTSIGTGLLLPPPFLDQLAAGVADDLGMSGPEIADSAGSFVVIDLAAGIDPTAWLRDHEASMVAWDPFGVPPLTHTDPVRPPVVIDVQAMQRVPTLLAGVLAVAMGASIVAGVASGTLARHRELAILRALGGSAHQVRASVRWHALAVVGTGLVLGMPLGVVLGRVAFGAFAASIGAASEPVIPFGLLGLQAVAVLVLGLLAALVPGRRAAGGATLTRALNLDAAPAAT